MPCYEIYVDASTSAFYEKIAAVVDKPVEQVLFDALFKLAGELSLEALSQSVKGV